MPTLAVLLLAIPPLAFAQADSTPIYQPSKVSASLAPITLRAALDAAWALHPVSRASANRGAELSARARAAQSFTSGPPSISLAHRTDALSGNAGLREVEAEMQVPLWNPGMRRATQNLVAADVNALALQHNAERLKLAGEVRAAAAQIALARAERDAAARKHLEASQLADDVERRVKAGDLARVDSLQSRASAQQAQGQLAVQDAALVRALSQWRAMTGQTQVVELQESILGAAAQNTAANPSVEHPALLAAQAQVQSAHARLALTESDRRDPMELGLGVTRERAAAGANLETSLRFALRIPLGGDSRNAPKLAAARAELDAAQAQADAVVRQLDVDLAAASAGLDAAISQEALAVQRAELSGQMQALVAKSHRLGESDLPTRMRADNEKLDADLSLARARIELQRAMSQLNQSLGTFP
ncbi:MAG: TolC family protein [Candidatus Saccharibacteria bacterium]|nr:TolC family protein [Rhodoferax sp.]